MPSDIPAPQSLIAGTAAKLFDLTEHILLGDVWERPELSKRDGSLITVSALISLNRTEQLPFHLKKALDNGVTRNELIEAITHLAFYVGWPNAMTAVRIAREVLSSKVESAIR
jgi:4-carboxymuconolactone decarboxylase